MKKFLLLLIPIFSFAQNKPIIFPNCEKFETKQELLQCFQENTHYLILGYFQSNQNLLEYLQVPYFKENASFQINTKGKYIFKSQDKNTEMFSIIAKDIFRVINTFLERNELVVQPAQSEGKIAATNFIIPIEYKSNNNMLFEEKNPIRFTLQSNQKFIIRQAKDFKFLVYNENNELVEKIDSFLALVSHPLILQLGTTNLIVEKIEQDKKIKIMVNNILSNVFDPFNLKVFINDELTKEYKTMDDFMMGEYAHYIY